MPRFTLTAARAVVMTAATLALLLVVLGGPGSKYGWWDWRAGIWMLRIGAYAGLGSALAAIVLLALTAMPRWRVRPWVPLLALCIGLAAAVPPIILRAQAREVPPIHDITTDLQDPPAFVALRELRDKVPNGSAYQPANAAQQQQGYPDLKGKLLEAPPAAAMQKAIDAARSLGWEVVASDAAAGRVEATATTGWFGFKDDVVVRIRAEGTGSRIDVRSASRVGGSDLGTNAKRIRQFLDRIS